MKIHPINQYNISFKAGVTNIYSDFDGTFMPQQFKHDVVVKDQPPLDKKAFQDYFNGLQKLFNKIRGDKIQPKLQFSITTGRNLPEFNYFIQKIKERGLKVPLPDSVITSNGADEYLKNGNTMQFFTDKKMVLPYDEDDVNMEKREWIKKVSGGWDGDKIRENIKNILKKNKYTFLEAPTNQCTWSYPGNISLQSYLEKMFPIPQIYASIRKDGNLNFHIALPWVKEHRPEFQNEVETVDSGQKTSHISSEIKKSFEKAENLGIPAIFEKYHDVFNIHGEKTSAIIVRPTLKVSDKFLEHGGVLDKFHDIERRAKEIVDKGLNDLVIVAGDDNNDIKALDLRNYLTDAQNFDWNDKEKIEELKKLPIISIFIKHPNKDITLTANQNKILYKPYDMEKMLNADGIVRHIVVDETNPQRPHTLKEAIEIAITEYAKRNAEFRKNLSAEMIEQIRNNSKNHSIL